MALFLAPARGLETAVGPSWTVGGKNVLFLRVNFPDDPTEPISESAAQALMDEVSAFFRENSYGVTWLSTTVSPLLTLPRPKARYLDESGVAALLSDARQAAVAIGYRLDDYQLDCVYVATLPSEATSLASIGQKGVWLQCGDVGLACHEFGHNFGLWHANSWRTIDGSLVGPGANVEYGDPFDTMGTGGNKQWHFNACLKHKLGWLPESAIQTVTTNGIYRLYPSDGPVLQNGSFHALRLKKDFAREYWIETRRQWDGHPTWAQSLLLHWAPWGASSYGTQLLGVDPGSRGMDDGHLLPGQAFIDSELGLEILPLVPDDAPDAVDVLVQGVCQILVEAEDTGRASKVTVSTDALASQGRFIAPGAVGADAHYTVDLTVAGYYAIWLRLLDPPADLSGLLLSVDDGVGRAFGLEPASGVGPGRWARMGGEVADPPGALPHGTLCLEPGTHSLALHFGRTGIKLDCLLVSTALTRNTPPMISSMPPQAVGSGQTAGPIAFSVLDIETPAAALSVAAASSNPRLLPAENIRISGRGMERSLHLALAPGQFGTATVTLMVTDADHNRQSTEFAVAVVGPIQFALGATAPGDVLMLKAGSYFDAAVITRDVAIEGDPLGAVVIDGNRSGVPLTIASNTTVSLHRLTLRNGSGGAIRNDGVLTLTDCSVIGNRSGVGGGILNYGTLVLERCVVSSNFASTGGGIANYGTLCIKNSTIRDNLSSQNGGGICNQAAGQLVVQSSTINGNQTSSGTGAGVYNAGEMTLVTCTISGNVAGREEEQTDGGIGGGVENVGRAMLDSCTIAHNRAAVSAGGMRNGGTLGLQNCIVAGNILDNGGASDGEGTVTSQGHNLIGVAGDLVLTGDRTGNLLGADPLLAPLADNGGTTWTQALLKGSPAIDRGRGPALAVDQRGIRRPVTDRTIPGVNDGCDIGAFEYVSEDRPLLQVQAPQPGQPAHLFLAGCQPGSTYVLLASTNLVDWSALCTNRVSGCAWEVDDSTASTVPLRFYRVVRLLQ